jgi:protein Mpv17
MASIRRRFGWLYLVLDLALLAVNSRMTAGLLTPMRPVTTSIVHSSSKRYFRQPVVNSDHHHLTYTTPRRALEVMSDGDLHSSLPPPPHTKQQQSKAETSTSSPTSTTSHSETDPTALTFIAQFQQQQQQQEYQNSQISEKIQNHPVLQRLLGEDDDLSLQQKVINLVFLSAAFGYAAYTIFNIDNGMTRGWTMQEQVMRIPLDNWGAYESYLANKPIITKTLINVIIYLLGDWLSQTAFQGKHVLNFDISRTLRNGFIGLCFGPLVHQYYEFSDAILPPENGLVTRLEKIFMDQTIYLTVKCSIYISAVGLLAGEDWSTVKQTVKDKIVGVVFTAWRFWPIVHCITYRYVVLGDGL